MATAPAHASMATLLLLEDSIEFPSLLPRVLVLTPRNVNGSQDVFSFAVAVKFDPPNDHFALMRDIALQDWRRNFFDLKTWEEIKASLKIKIVSGQGATKSTTKGTAATPEEEVNNVFDGEEEDYEEYEEEDGYEEDCMEVRVQDVPVMLADVRRFSDSSTEDEDRSSDSSTEDEDHKSE